MTNPFRLSFEFFPPKSLDASFRLWNAVDTLAGFDPDFVSITYGAGGSTREATRSAAKVIKKNYGLNVAGHLTCVDASKIDTMRVVADYARIGIKDIVALRGDPSSDDGVFTPHPNGYTDSLELIEALALTGRFNVRVGAYPNTHPEAASDDADIAHLKAKFDAGAHSAITQFFFESEDFLRFRDRCVKAGITQKITPGILPIEDFAKTQAFAARCGANTPDWMVQSYRHADNSDAARLLSTAICTELCDDLLCEGVDDLHFYTLNDATLTRDVCHALGRSETLAAQAVA